MAANQQPDDGGPFLVGLIADIQYSDREDGTDFSGKQKRYFRNALRITESAVSHWNAHGVSKVVQLGDVIDGLNAKAGASQTALRTVLGALEQCAAAERLDLIGNHELYNVRRADLPASGLNVAGPDGLTYRSVHLGPHWEAIILDPYEHALIGVPDDHAGFLKAKEILAAQNPNVLAPAAGCDWFDGLPVERHRYVPYNGGVSQEQLEWLEGALLAAEADNRAVAIFTHVPLFRPATQPKTVVWNCEEVLAVLHRHKDSVMAVFAGHDHDGGYAVDSAGLHHVTMNSPLTATPGTDCFAVLECFEGWARFVASGRACVETGTEGKGRAYPELVLAKGAANQPSGALAADAVAPEEALAQLAAMGFPSDKASLALEACGGNVEAAAAMCCG